jgi:nucleoside-diphosphate-sugar epimerase
MRIAISGSTSSIGRNLEKFLVERGHEVMALGGSNSDIWKLGMPFPKSIQAETLIHLAHDRSMKFKDHVKATNILVDSFDGYTIFLSSMSAHSKCKSLYGKIKYTSESIVTTNCGSSIRAGVVYGTDIEGIFGLLQRILHKLPIIPLPFRGKSRLFTCHIEDLCLEILMVAELRPKGVSFAAYYWPISFKQLVFYLKIKNRGDSKYLVEIPNLLTKAGIFVLKALPPFRRSVDSLNSLEQEIDLMEMSALNGPLSKFRANDYLQNS